MTNLRELLEILACPQCKGPLSLADQSTVQALRPQWVEKWQKQADSQSAPSGELEGGFICTACQLFYPVVDGIPDFVLDDALALQK